jgi:hypothetical protein
MIALATVLQSNNVVEILDLSNNLMRTSNLTQSLVSNTMSHFARTLQANYGLKAVYLSKLGITDWIMCDFLAKSIGDNQNLVTLDLGWLLKIISATRLVVTVGSHCAKQSRTT